ncbi:uncharacterized protein [Haliotis asinina]|uniref:uncharacterized protein n=1 Tax=Haliotis asinina TaxID=109174 RepID=UPI003531BC10
MDTLQQVVTDPKFLAKFHYFRKFRHTGALESFNSHILMYCPKRHSYQFIGYCSRSQLAAIDHKTTISIDLIREPVMRKQYTLVCTVRGPRAGDQRLRKSRRTIQTDGAYRWGLQMGPTDGAYRWDLQMGPTDGAYRWDLQMGPTDGTYRWGLQMGPTDGTTDGTYRWGLQMGPTDGGPTDGTYRWGLQMGDLQMGPTDGT